MGILAQLIGAFLGIGFTIETKMVGAFNAIVLAQPDEQKKILHDSMKTFLDDRAKGKSYGEAAADALTKFYSGEKEDVNKSTKKLFEAFLEATQ